MAWTVAQSLIEAQGIAVVGMATIAIGLLGYVVLRAKTRAKPA